MLSSLNRASLILYDRVDESRREVQREVQPPSVHCLKIQLVGRPSESAQVPCHFIIVSPHRCVYSILPTFSSCKLSPKVVRMGFGACNVNDGNWLTSCLVFGRSH